LRSQKESGIIPLNDAVQAIQDEIRAGLTRTL